MRLAILSQSARIYSQLAHQEGFEVLAVDAFADKDTQEAAQQAVVWPGFGRTDMAQDMPALFAELDAFSPEAVLVGSGFEAQPESYQALYARYAIMANPPEVVRQAKDPFWLKRACDQAGILSPVLSRQQPAQGDWVCKQAGQCGGQHVQLAFYASGPVQHNAAEQAISDHQRYWQAFQTGLPVGILFVAQGTTFDLIGVHALKQRPDSFAYAGASRLQDRRIFEAAHYLISTLLPQLNVTGLNSIDALWHAEALHVIEVNPRLSASMRLYADLPLIQMHVDCFQGNRPAKLARSGVFASHCIAYATQTLQLSPQSFPDWVEDRPVDGRIDVGQPICSFYAEAETERGVRVALQNQKTQLEKLWGTYVCKHIEFNIH